MLGEIDVLLIQEHKVFFAHAHSCGELLTGGLRTLWEPATCAMFHSGGVCISIGQRWLAHVQGHGILVAQRAMWVSLQFEHRILGLMSVYALTDDKACATCWDDIFHTLLIVDSWLIGGDFNSVENASDVRAFFESSHHFDCTV